MVSLFNIFPPGTFSASSRLFYLHRNGRTQDPVPTVEARQVGANVADFSIVIEICQILPVAHGRCLYGDDEINKVRWVYARIALTLSKVLMEESTAVLQVSIRTVSLGLNSLVYLG